VSTKKAQRGGEAAQPPPDDDAARQAAISERVRNVLVDAGAGTGKTQLVVDRILALIAPSDDALPAMSIDRIAAVTFTRRAAGELKLRVRKAVLDALSLPGLSPVRHDRLAQALGGLDTAYIGTIHSFADRLLRLRPVEAGLGPSYELVEDAKLLVREAYEALMQAVEAGTLATAVAGQVPPKEAREAEQTVGDALSAGVRPEEELFEWGTGRFGLDSLVRGFVEQRDVEVKAKLEEVDLAALRKALRELVKLAKELGSASPGSQLLRSMAKLCEGHLGDDDPLVLYRALVVPLRRGLKGGIKRSFPDDPAGKAAWKVFDKGDPPVPPLRSRIVDPLTQWLGTRLARLRRVVIALYEKVKARHQVLDQLDLLIVLRDLLRRDLPTRRYFRDLFDHVFVDEFQDTDPLQAEILILLCDASGKAVGPDEVTVAPGRLTIVGDPKQSIYRFRRADVAMYDQVRRRLREGRALEVSLSSNFRSAPGLIAWFNERLERVLGAPGDDGAPFDVATGEVFYQPLVAGARGAKADVVHAIPLFCGKTKPNAEDWRSLEGAALPRYLRWLLEEERFQVRDPRTGVERPATFGDVAVLALATTNLPLLLAGLDEQAIPYAARGGTLFLRNPVAIQFLLGLRALADWNDGVAKAALLRPPFFAVDLADLVRARQEGEETRHAGARRALAAQALVTDLRRRRFARGPGETARDLLERTAFGRHVALGRNGKQQLDHLRELCLLLEQTAAEQRLDYDGATALMRSWVPDPVQLDAPHPVDSDAVQIMTVHQAKGLEFPIVVFWDGAAGWSAHQGTRPWFARRDGKAWLLTLDGLSAEQPAGGQLKTREKSYADAERKRLVYVAATRARDLFVMARAPTKGGKHISELLVEADTAGVVRELEDYPPAARGTHWSKRPPPAEPEPARPNVALERDLSVAWAAALAESSRPRYAPTSVTALAKSAPAVDPPEDRAAPRARREGRFGPVFGETVHRAIGFILTGHLAEPSAAIEAARAWTGLDEYLDEARADVARTLEALRTRGLPTVAGDELVLEYPVAFATDGHLVTGYIDYLAIRADQIWVIDFKTDAMGNSGPLPAYEAQVVAYQGAVNALAEARRVRAGLLYCGHGVLHEVGR